MRAVTWTDSVSVCVREWREKIAVLGQENASLITGLQVRQAQHVRFSFPT